ncbi:Rne/Rng family ribonuclease [Desulfovibrio intestinalis]|uniref:Ribonuclease G n=1 Tax=Desulfovibrio intestinalis TaxID=58621 RepID=A0A7W8C238_9BACT|nr:Rne/Rng family ribonuclease [Desulfovibrio intestinalis]MBB5142305.1 ribonuclease E [Desulfovibrio intestinalis]
MTKDQETPVTETKNSGETSPKPSKPKTRTPARGKTATAPAASAKKAEKTSPPSSPASNTSPKDSSSSASADSAPKATTAKATRRPAGKAVASKKSATPDTAKAEKPGSVSGAAVKPAKSAEPATASADKATAKSAEKTSAPKADASTSVTADSGKKNTAKPAAARGRKPTAKTGKDTAAPAKASAKTASVAAAQEKTPAGVSVAAKSRSPKADESKAPARPDVAKTEAIKPDASKSAAGKPASAELGKTAAGGPGTDTRSSGAPKPRPSTRARTAAPRKKTAAQSSTGKPAAHIENKISPASPASANAAQPQNVPDSPANAGQKPSQAARAVSPVTAFEDQIFSLTATATSSSEVLALASGEKLAITSRESLAITGSETLALVATTDSQDADGHTEGSGDAPRRKNRRGRRGGRGRNRRKEQNGDTAEMQSADNAADDDVKDAVAQNGQSQTTAEADQARSPSPADTSEKGKSEAVRPASNKTAPAAVAGKVKSETGSGRRRMFISVLPGEQVEVALTEDGQLLEYYLDMLHQRKIKGNIYKGVIHNIDTNLQAAFVSYGAGKNGFLQIDEIHPEYWLTHHEPAKGKKFPPIQKVLKAGQEVLVQVVKEPTGSKGAFLTTWLSLAGRFLVLTPGQEQIGVSRKVDDDEERTRLREMMNGIDPGQGLGVIVRTVSAGTTKTTLKNDLQYLKRVWRDIRKKATEVTAPSLIYQEPGLSERAVRDYLTEDVGEIWVDNEDVAQSIRETVNLLFPRKSDLVRLHSDARTSMWERFNLRRQLDQIYTREVLLPSGGRLVFDQTEALMAIDINSGKISGKGNFEAMAHKTNMEAAEAIARHLKLRDIGGQVVIDFIEMRDKKHVIEVEKTLRTIMKNDRARHDVGRMSSFGLLELVRQRTGSSALAITMEPCPACGGTGQRRNLEWQALQVLRELRRMMRAESKEKCIYSASPELALYLLNHKRDSLREMEQAYSKCLEISVRP